MKNSEKNKILSIIDKREGGSKSIVTTFSLNQVGEEYYQFLKKKELDQKKKMQENTGSKMKQWKYKEIISAAFTVNPNSHKDRLGITVRGDSLGFVTIVFGNDFSIRLDEKEAANLAHQIAIASRDSYRLVEEINKNNDNANKKTAKVIQG